MENPIQMDDLGVPRFMETPTWQSPAIPKKDRQVKSKTKISKDVLNSIFLGG